MGEDERADWLSVAMSELLTPPSVPNSYFRQACAHARRVCDHPAKIVPAIFAFDPGAFANRRTLEKELNEILGEMRNMDSARLEAAQPKYCTPEEARDILAKFGAKSAYDSRTTRVRNLRMPTADELAEMALIYRRQHGFDDPNSPEQDA